LNERQRATKTTTSDRQTQRFLTTLRISTMLPSTIEKLISTARPAPSDSHRRVAAGPPKGKGAGLHVILTRSGECVIRGGRPIHPHCRRRSISTARPAPSDSHRRVAAGPPKGKGAGLHVILTRSGECVIRGAGLSIHTNAHRPAHVEQCPAHIEHVEVRRGEGNLWTRKCFGVCMCVCDRVVGHFYGLPRPGE
jgi:hypothetical protein